MATKCNDQIEPKPKHRLAARSQPSRAALEREALACAATTAVEKEHMKLMSHALCARPRSRAPIEANEAELSLNAQRGNADVPLGRQPVERLRGFHGRCHMTAAHATRTVETSSGRGPQAIGRTPDGMRAGSVKAGNASPVGAKARPRVAVAFSGTSSSLAQTGLYASPRRQTSDVRERQGPAIIRR
jgi:hypothetical protein